MRQDVQTEALCLGVAGPRSPCVENRRWTIGGVTYATLNIQGSCNNLCDTAPDAAEYAARNQANIAWLHETFDEATGAPLGRDHAHRAGQSRLGPVRRDAGAAARSEDARRRPTASPTASWSSSARCATRSIAFRKPVAYVHGDSHYFRVDKPFLDSLGRRLENFTRVETFGNNAANGNNDVQWVKVLVDAAQPRGLRVPAADRARQSRRGAIASWRVGELESW